MGMTCEEALANNLIYGTGSSKKTTSDSGTLPLTAGTGLSGASLEDILSNAVKKLSKVDCPETVKQWLEDTKPFSYVVSALNNSINGVHTISGEAITAVLQSSTTVDAICGVITNIYSVLNGSIVMVANSAKLIFNSIDDARLRLQEATKKLTSSIMKCIMGVYDMVEGFLCEIVKLSVVTDWSGLQACMSACPCICKFIAWLTGCNKDSNGNDISSDSSQVIACLQNKFSFINAANIGIGISSIMTGYIKNYLKMLFDLVNQCIDLFFSMLVIPLRGLIKKYIMLMRKKFDMSFLIDSLKETGLDCLLVYTNEKHKDGTAYYGMSVLDMIASMRSWLACITYPCQGLSEKIKNKLKWYNTALRLDGDFWSNEFECDLYAVCIGSADNAEEYLKGMKNKWNGIWDKIRSKKMDVKHCADDAEDSSYGQNSAVNDMRATFGEDDPSDHVKDAAKFVESPNMEYMPNNGVRPLTKREDDVLFRIGQNIFDATAEEDEYFVELWYQYLRFIGRYKLLDPSFKKICEFAANVCQLTSNFNGSSTTQFAQNPGRRPDVDYPDIIRRVNYYFTSDYDSNAVYKIMNANVPAQYDYETLTDYFARLYSVATS